MRRRGSLCRLLALLALCAIDAASQRSAVAGDAASLEREAMARAKAGEYEKAEALFSRALAADPDNFKLLYNLGIAASFAGHNERAREVLGKALRQQPKNVDVLYALAYAHAGLKQNDSAVRLLAQAARLAPARADVQKLLAITAGDLGAFADSLAAWDRYLKLAPEDAFARRERGYTAACTGAIDEGIADLKWFLQRHPEDPIGHYELALAENETDAADALSHLDIALSLKPDFAEALSARGSLYYRQGKPEAAVADLELAAKLRPGHAINLDRLGQTYLALDRSADAVRVLRRAAGLAPDDARIQLHFGRALADAGQAAESKTVMDRFRQLGPAKKQGVPAGLVDYLSLTPEQQRADYRARVEKAVTKNPADAAARLHYLQLLLEEGDIESAAAVARRIAALKPESAILAGAGRALLVSKQYALAKDLLEQAAASRSSPEIELDLAIATFRAGGASEALARMDRVPESERGGDYHLARAEMLDAAGRPADAAAALNQALRAAPKREDLYVQAALFLVDKGRTPDAVRLLDEGVRALPRNRDVLLMQGTTLELAGNTAAAERVLDDVQNRWPEWHAGWIARGIVLAAHQRFDEARQNLETGVMLGARSPEVWAAYADSAFRSSPKRMDAAASAVRQALKLAPGDPWIQSLARLIASEQRSSPGAPAPRQLNPAPPGVGRRYTSLFRTKLPRDW